MKRQALEEHLRRHGCIFNKHGKKHDHWINPITLAQAPIPRHDEIKFGTARNICRDLGVPDPPSR